MAEKKQGRINVIKSNLKDSDRISLIYNDEEVEMSIKDFKSELSIENKPYKSYVALLSQSGTSDPTVSILENDLGDIVWTRSDVGQYGGTLAGAFLQSKTFYNTDTGMIEVNRSTDDYIIVKSGEPGLYEDDILFFSPIEIRVYN